MILARDHSPLASDQFGKESERPESWISWSLYKPPGDAAETTLRMARLASGSGNDAAGRYYHAALNLRGGAYSPVNLELLEEMAIYYEAQGKMELASSLRGIAERVAGDRP